MKTVRKVNCSPLERLSAVTYGSCVLYRDDLHILPDNYPNDLSLVRLSDGDITKNLPEDTKVRIVESAKVIY